jgi:hypothetical protein
MGSKQVIAVLLVAIAVQFVAQAHGNGFGSVLRLIGDGLEEQEVACGPQVDIETPACTVVESKSGYELRKYPEGEVSFGFGCGFSCFSIYCKICL